MYRSILVPLDGSTASEQSLPLVQRLAERSGAVVHLVHVHTLHDTIYVEGLPVIDDQLHSLARDHERAYLDGACAEMADAGVQVICANPSEEGSVAATLARYAEAAGCDLIVTATHSRGGFERMWLGSVTDALIRCTDVPVLLLRPDAEQPQIDHILVALDGSSLSEQTLEPAGRIATMTGASVTLFQVVAPLVLGQAGRFTQAVDLAPERTREREQTAQRYLDSCAELLRSEQLEVATQVVVAEAAAPALLAAAAARPNTLIALATHGRRGLVRLLLGSVADKVVRGAAGPALIVRPQMGADGE